MRTIEVTNDFLVKFRDYIEAAGGKIKVNTDSYLAGRFFSAKHAGGFAALMAEMNPRMYIQVKGSVVYLHDPARYMESVNEARLLVHKLSSMDSASGWVRGKGSRSFSWRVHENLIRKSMDVIVRANASSADVDWSKDSKSLQLILTSEDFLDLEYVAVAVEDWAIDMTQDLGGVPKIWVDWTKGDYDTELALTFFMRR